MTDRLNINNEMAALDRKDREYYDNFTDEERKKFSTYLMLKWGSAVQGSSDLQEYYLRAMNENVNMNFFDLARHPKLQWLLCTTVSPDMGVQKHWFPKSQGRGKQNAALKFLKLTRPAAKIADLEVLVQLNDQRYFENLAREHGWTDREIRDFFK